MINLKIICTFHALKCFPSFLCVNTVFLISLLCLWTILCVILQLSESSQIFLWLPDSYSILSVHTTMLKHVIIYLFQKSCSFVGCSWPDKPVQVSHGKVFALDPQDFFQEFMERHLFFSHQAASPSGFPCPQVDTEVKSRAFLSQSLLGSILGKWAGLPAFGQC